MPNKLNTIVFQLIKSLNKAEKRNFKLYATRNSSIEDLKFIILFDALDKMMVYNEAQLLKKNESIKKAQLSNLCALLYKQILGSLRLIKDDDNIDMVIREQLDFARILLNKGLYIQSLQSLEKAKKIAVHYEQNTYLSQILFFEKQIESQYITRSIENRAEILIDSSNDVFAELNEINNASNVALKLYSWYIKNGHARSKEDKQLLETFISSINNPKYTNNIYSQLYYRQSYCWYSFIQMDFVNYYKHAQQWVNLFHKKEDFIKLETANYLKGIHNVLNALFYLRQFNKYFEYLNLLEKIIEENKIAKTNNTNILCFTYLYTAKLNYHFISGEFTKGLYLVPLIETQLQQYQHFLDKHRVFIFYYKIASLYFGSGNYDNAIDYLNKIINWKVDLRNDIQCYSRLLHLIAHFELGNYDLLESLLKSTYRFMAKMENLSTVENKMFAFLRGAFKLNRKAMKQAFEKLLVAIAPYEQNIKEARTFVYLDVTSWLQSKIDNVAVEKIIQQKYKARNKAN
jgi:hypothetical protein